MENKNPEESRFFSHWEYTGNAIQRATKTGPRKPMYMQNVEIEEAEEWADKHSARDIIAFADANPDIEVQQEVDGVMKTITLPFWARDRLREEPQSYYKKSPYVFRCVDVKAKALAAIPWSVYPKKPEDKSVEAYTADNEIVKLLQEINPEDNWHDFTSKLSKDLDLYGKAFVKKVRKGNGVDGQVLLLMRLNPATVKVKADSNGISHFVQQTGSTSQIIERENMLYFRDYDPDDDTGSVSPLQACKKNIDIEIYANDYLSEHFENGAIPAVIMSSPNNIQVRELNRMTGLWGKNFKGKGNRGKTAFVGDGFEPKQLTVPLNQLSLKEIREESQKAICTAFGVRMTAAGANEAANRSTAEVDRSALYTETIIPRAEYMQGVFNAELVQSEFEQTAYFDFEPEKLDVMQEDRKEKATVMALLVENRIIKPEVAAVEMGFDEADVPEPLPNPFQDVLEQPENDFGEQEDDKKAYNALRKFRRKSVNRCKDGRNPSCSFITEYVSDGTIKAIQQRLDGVELVDDVHAVFDEFE